MTDNTRKGARSIKDIPANILCQLNSGEIQTANLMEWLAVDKKVLLENILIQCDRKIYLQPILEKIDNLKKQTINTVNDAIGTVLFELITTNNDNDFMLTISTHKSDLVRTWAACSIGQNSKLDINQMLLAIRPFAKDTHFSVREEAWMVARRIIAENLSESIAILSIWANDDDENVRRFASEATRPRGVWCNHIGTLKQNPELGLQILEPLKSDESKYVRDSVGNWLNDASKTQPKFVEDLCVDWQKESDTKETSYIIKRALRTIAKQRAIR